MDINELRSLVTLVWMVAFVAIVFWAWSRKRHKEFDEAANLPLNEQEFPNTNKHKDQAS